MDFLKDFVGKAFNKEELTFTTIQDTLEDVAEELGCSYNELFIKIAANDKDFSPVFHIFRAPASDNLEKIAGWKFIREITLKEILNTK